MPRVLFCLFLLFSLHSSAQKIYGTVYNKIGDLLPYASITVKGTSIGASANNKAHFSFTVSPGTYTVVCQHIGYTKQEKSVTIKKSDEELTFILADQKLDMAEVVVKSNAEDPAYAIIRQAIKKRPYYAKQVNGFNVELYSKDMLKLRRLPNKILGRKIPDEDRREMMLDSSGKGIIYLSESVSKVHFQQPEKFKMEVLSSRVSGNDGFGFTFPAFISLYNSNVNVFDNRLNPRGFVSPIADGAISMYKFKYLGSFYEDGKEINSIRVTPRRTYEPLFSGIINITDGDWRIHSFDLMLTKSSQLELIDSLQITQIHVPVGKDIWRVKNQLLHFNFKQFGIDAVGNFVNVYSNYEINPTFSKKFFDRVVIKYDTAVNKKSKSLLGYHIRPVPLEPEERKDYQVRDSIFEVQKDSLLSQSSIDTLKKRQGKLKPLNIFWKGISRTHYSKTNTFDWGIESLIKGLEYNTAEGLVLNVSGYFDKHLSKLKSNLSVEPNLRYGFNNTHLNAWVNLVFRTRDWDTDKKIRRQTWTFSVESGSASSISRIPLMRSRIPSTPSSGVRIS
ncbi:MAG: carboxypeptidase-like regulatory domain-containing protein [Chitinophagaceae bacterium]|nr:carboxypeptidase-like regulatory domain-containing protein [Chitinophagaceae bacterium]